MLLRRLEHENKKQTSASIIGKTAVIGLVAGSVCSAAFFAFSRAAFAAAQVELGLNYATAIGLGTQDIRTTVAKVIYYFLGLLGIVGVVLVLYAGFLWMTSQGNEEKVTQAKRILINAIIGLCIIMSAYAITYFIFRAITGEGGITTGGGGGSGTQLAGMYCRDCASGELGKNLEYHYPEVGQTGVPRNTKVAITMKKPLVLSTIFKNYDDKGTFQTADDVICTPDCANRQAEISCVGKSEADCAAADPFCGWTDKGCILAPVLNMTNFAILPNDSLGDVKNTANKDEDFNARYPGTASGSLAADPPRAMVSPLGETFDPNGKGQTIVIKPNNPIGSSDTEMNYRVALRGGANGVQLWGPPPSGTDPQKEKAFSNMAADGSYFWTFTTSTALDTQPPKLDFLWPMVMKTPSDNRIPRNKLLSIYFDEAVDPTTVTGKTGGGGFNWINVEAKCRQGTDENSCPFGKPGAADFDNSVFRPIDGTWEISNRYRTVEFKSDTPCESVAENSCGEPVFCLPKNVDLRITVKPSAVDPKSPPAGGIFPANGVTDMVGNSFDGNKNDKGEGPTKAGLNDYDYNDFLASAPDDLSTYSDTAVWQYVVGEELDLVPPAVTVISPVSAPRPDINYPDGPSNVPIDPNIPVSVTWSKVMSPSSMSAGTTVYMNSREMKKISGTDCQPGDFLPSAMNKCVREVLGPPTVVIDAGKPVKNAQQKYITVMKIMHRPYFSANDLGWSEQEATDNPEVNPVYLPVIRAQVRDDSQNCFFPSQGYDCSIEIIKDDKTVRVPTDEVNNPSCLDRTAGPSFNWNP